MKNTLIFISLFFLVLGLGVGVSGTQAADSLTGTWNLAVDSPAGKGSPTFALQQDGEKVTGTYNGAFGQSKVTGKIQGNDFELSFNSSGNDVTYKGKVEGNKMSGSLDMGSIGKGTFTGEKK